VATIVQETKRASDILVRLGDDEFAVVLPDCTSEEAGLLTPAADRLAREQRRRPRNRPHVGRRLRGADDLQSEQETASLVERARVISMPPRRAQPPPSALADSLAADPSVVSPGRVRPRDETRAVV
jgi:GGDEF domain-containing protein